MTASRRRELHFDPPYDQMFEGVLAFGTLMETESTLTRLENLRQRFLAASDKKGVEYCRRLGRQGRERAEMISRNRRVDANKRLLKQEAALWFRIWLETPELFAEWLFLRKRTPEYQKLPAWESP
jgi:hypothetical protein